MTRKLILATVLMLSITMVSCTTKPKDVTTDSNSNTTVEQNKDSNSSSDTSKEELGR